MSNNIDWGKIYDSTNWGVGVNNDISWGITYKDLAGSDDFIITVKTDNAGTSASDQFTIPTTGTGFLYDITTSDGYTATGVTGNHTITFPSGAGTHTVTISGSFPQCYFNNGGDNAKLMTIENFGIYALGSTSQSAAFWGCSNLVISATDSGNFGNVTNFYTAWNGCSSLTSFPLINTSSGTIFSSTWRSCSSLTSFPLLDTSSGTNFDRSWYNCLSLTSFPLLDTSSSTDFYRAWRGCSSLASYPANAFDTNIATNYSEAFQSTNLTTQSIDDILVSLDTSGVSNGTFAQSGGSAPSAVGLAAIANLTTKGWTITTTSLTIVQNFKTIVIADGGTFEAEACLNAVLTNLNDIQ